MKLYRKVLLITLSLVMFTCLNACGLDDGEVEKLDNNSKQVQEKLVALANDKGYEITYRYDATDVEQSTSTIGANGAYSWFYHGNKESGIAFEKYNGLTLYYTLENGNWVYRYAFEYDKNSSLYSMDLTDEFSMFLQAYDFSDSLKKAKSAKIAGRDCDVYTFNLSSKGQIIGGLVGVDAKWSYYIDKETGICLKFEVSGNDGETTNEATFEVTEFKTSATISGLRHPNDIYPINGKDPNVTGNWNYLAFVNLSNILPTKDMLISDDNYSSNEILGIGYAIYNFKVLDVANLEDAQNYMCDYYQDVVSKIKVASDDNKCYSSESEEDLIEAQDTIEDTLMYNLLFKYHEELYEISFMIDDAYDTEYNSFILIIEINKVNE